MESAHIEIVSLVGTNERSHTLLHLARRLVGEGESENIPGFHAATQQIGYLARKHTRFARACSSDNELRAIDILHSFTLTWTEG